MDSSLATFIEMFDKKDKAKAKTLVAMAEELLDRERKLLDSEQKLLDSERKLLDLLLDSEKESRKLLEKLLDSEKKTIQYKNEVIQRAKEDQAHANTEILKLRAELSPRAAFGMISSYCSVWIWFWKLNLFCILMENLEFYEDGNVGRNGGTRFERWKKHLEKRPVVSEQLRQNIPMDIDLPNLATLAYRLLSEK